jgi:hypothetical protein
MYRLCNPKKLKEQQIKISPNPIVFDDDGLIQFPVDLADENDVGVQADLNVHDEPQLQQQPPTPLKLSYLKESFDLRHHSTAIADLMDSKRIVIDDKYTLDRSHYFSDVEQMMTLNVQDFYLDFTMYVGLLAGFGAIMPTPEADHSWVFVMNVRNQSRNFRPKHSWIGFDISGRMIDVGTVRGREHVWIAFAPDAIVAGEKELDPPSTGNSAAPHVTKVQYRKFLLFLATCLSEMRFSDIYCVDPYVDVEEPSAFERSTNIL